MKKNRNLLFFIVLILLISSLYWLVSTDLFKNSSQVNNSFEFNFSQDIDTSFQEKNQIQVKPKLIRGKADKIISFAESRLGLPYKQAGVTTKGYDCSGLVMTSFKAEGVKLPRTSIQMSKVGKKITFEEIKQGDLVFFATQLKSPKKINHVGLVTKVSNGVIYFIHSSSSKGVIISNTDENFYKKAFVKAKRIL